MRLLAMMAAAALASEAAAQTTTTITTPTSGFHYFNRPGATAEQHAADLSGCRDAIEGYLPNGERPLFVTIPGAASPTYIPYTYVDPSGGAGGGMSAGAAGATLAVGAIIAADAAVTARRIRYANFENCMIVRGWRIAQLDEATGREFDDLEPDALAARLAPLVGADTDAPVLRAFGNDVSRGDVVVFETPNAFDEVSMSIRTLPPREDLTDEERASNREAVRAAQAAFREENRANRRDPVRRAAHQALLLATTPVIVAPREVAALPADSTLIVVHFGGEMQSELNPSLTFTRIPDDSATATPEARASSTFTVSPPRRFAAPPGERRLERAFVVSVPPGRWRLVSMQARMQYADFCLGAPSFEVGQGEVVYAGAYATDGAQRGPDLSMARANEALASAPALAARLRPATYRNGERSTCGFGYYYAYEVDGAPFADGYTHGSNAGATQAAALAPLTPEATAVITEAAAVAEEATPAEATPAPTTP